MTTWREKYRPIIAKVLADTAGMPGPFVAKALQRAYPAAQRSGWAYQCWLDECARQRGRKKGRIRRATSKVVKIERAEQAGQTRLFDPDGGR